MVRTASRCNQRPPYGWTLDAVYRDTDTQKEFADWAESVTPAYFSACTNSATAFSTQVQPVYSLPPSVRITHGYAASRSRRLGRSTINNYTNWYFKVPIGIIIYAIQLLLQYNTEFHL